MKVATFVSKYAKFITSYAGLLITYVEMYGFTWHSTPAMTAITAGLAVFGVPNGTIQNVISSVTTGQTASATSASDAAPKA